MNPPSIAFTIPFVPVAVGVVVNNNGVLPDGSNPGTPDTTSVLVINNVVQPSAVSAAVDPSNNRRVIVTPGVLAPGGSPVPWSFRISVAGKPAFVTVSGTTPAPADVAGVTWDGAAVGPA